MQRVVSGLKGVVGVTAMVLFVVGFPELLRLRVEPSAHAPESLPTTAIRGLALAYIQSDSSGASIQIRQSSFEGQTDTLTLSDSVWVAAPPAEQCQIASLQPAPQGQWIAVQSFCEWGSSLQIIETASGRTLDLDFYPASLPEAIFLDWTPDGAAAFVLTNHLIGSQVYRVDFNRGEAQLILISQRTYDLDLSPDGTRILYSLTRGLGYGSETWIADADGQNARLVWVEPAHLVTLARWSLTGDHIAYIRIPDTNVPFPVGELWVTDGEGNQPMFLSAADGGRGSPPVWSPDGARIAFVGRENPDNPSADQQAEHLLSNIDIAEMSSGSVYKATPFTGALTENPSWSPDGAYLTFNTNAAGTMDVWVYDLNNHQTQPVTQSANARYPVWLVSQPVDIPTP
jgi:hypothetical protein